MECLPREIWLPTNGQSSVPITPHSTLDTNTCTAASVASFPSFFSPGESRADGNQHRPTTNTNTNTSRSRSRSSSTGTSGKRSGIFRRRRKTRSKNVSPITNNRPSRRALAMKSQQTSMDAPHTASRGSVGRFMKSVRKRMIPKHDCFSFCAGRNSNVMSSVNPSAHSSRSRRNNHNNSNSNRRRKRQNTADDQTKTASHKSQESPSIEDEDELVAVQMRGTPVYEYTVEETFSDVGTIEFSDVDAQCRAPLLEHEQSALGKIDTRPAVASIASAKITAEVLPPRAYNDYYVSTPANPRSAELSLPVPTPLKVQILVTQSTYDDASSHFDSLFISEAQDESNQDQEHIIEPSYPLDESFVATFTENTQLPPAPPSPPSPPAPRVVSPCAPMDEKEDNVRDEKRKKRNIAEENLALIGRIIVFDPTAEMLLDDHDSHDDAWKTPYTARKSQLRELQKSHEHVTSSLLATSPPSKSGGNSVATGESSLDELLRVDDECMKNILGSLPQLRSAKPMISPSPEHDFFQQDDDEDEFDSAYESAKDVPLLDRIAFQYSSPRSTIQPKPFVGNSPARHSVMRSPETTSTSVTWVSPQPTQPTLTKENMFQPPPPPPARHGLYNTISPPNIVRQQTPAQEIEIVFYSEGNESKDDESVCDESGDSSYYTPKYDWFLPEHANVEASKKNSFAALADRFRQKSASQRAPQYQSNISTSQRQYTNKFRPISPAPTTPPRNSSWKNQQSTGPPPLALPTPSYHRKLVEASRNQPYKYNLDYCDDDKDFFSDRISNGSDAVDDLMVFCASEKTTKSSGGGGGVLSSLYRMAGFGG